MLQKTSNNFRGFFLKEFTKELLKNSQSQETTELKEKIKILQEKQDFKNKIKKKLEEKQREELIKTKLIYFDKINRPIQDEEVVLITCLGEKENILIKKTNGDIKKTFIILNKEDINEVIKIFSEKGKTSITNGIIKSHLGNLTLKSTLSDLVDGKFRIEKIL